ncbi:hypothetical protein [Nostoc sp. NZL]|uniref:hypothetical protein n=1 Tax=Nostoc sp. NZL TaxID=2650612 RepID=UPI0018C5E54B|nr:hypothetical protein [Nostoc sp. NZL]
MLMKNAIAVVEVRSQLLHYSVSNIYWFELIRLKAALSQIWVESVNFIPCLVSQTL